jgi:hypothetical protein
MSLVAGTAEWSLAAAAGPALGGRRGGALAVGLVGVSVALACGIAVGVALGDARVGLLAGSLVVSGALWLATSLWATPPAMRTVHVSVHAPGRLEVDGAVVSVRSIEYDPTRSLLWARGPLGLPRACIEAHPELASELVEALHRPERGLRTLSGTPPMAAIPVVGFFLVMAVCCAVVLGLIMSLWGPPHVGVPIALVAIPLAVLTLRPSRIHVGQRDLEWSWWGFRRAIPLASIRRVEASSQCLQVHLRDGRTLRLQVRTAGNGAMGTASLENRTADRLASFAAFVERCGGEHEDCEAPSPE